MELQSVEPGLAPSGFIFHMSRCGSTLAAQLLAALPQNIVISEAEPIDNVLRANWRYPRITDEQRIAWLRGLLSALARPRHQGQHFFVKFDSWHTLELPIIQRAFPGVPWIFLYREPVQVLASHQRQRGAQMVPGLLSPQWLRLDEASLAGISPDDYCARVLAQICQAAWQHRNANALFLNYRQLPSAIWTEIAGHFRVDHSDEDIDRMRQATQFDAKNPGLFFAEDISSKLRAATPAIRQLAERWLMPIYTALEAR
jgi:gluconate kinase